MTGETIVALTVGMLCGTALGVLLACMLVVARTSPEDAEADEWIMRESEKGKRK